MTLEATQVRSRLSSRLLNIDRPASGGKVIILGDQAQQLLEIDGDIFEYLVCALGIRHLAIHPRTGAILPRQFPSAKFLGLIDRKWSSIDATAQQFPVVRQAAESLQKLLASANMFGWEPFNRSRP